MLDIAATLELFRWLSAALVVSHFCQDVEAQAQRCPKRSADFLSIAPAPRPWLPRFPGRECVQSVARIMVCAAVKVQTARRAHRVAALRATRDAVYDRILLGRYGVIWQHCIGEGDASFCFKGHNLNTDEDVAVKICKLNPENQDSQRVKLNRTVAMLRTLNPGVGPLLLDFSKDEAGSPGPDGGLMFVVTELALYSLRDRMNYCGHSGSLLMPHEMKYVAYSAISAVARLHSRHLVHVDLKPENIMIFKAGLKLIDVDGLQAMGSVMEIENETVSFTLQYVPPEMEQFLATGRNAPVADATLDLWSVGMTLLEVALLEHPLLRFLGAGREAEMAFVRWLAALQEVPLEGLAQSYPGMDKVVEPLVCCDNRVRGSAVDSLAHPWFG